jgi:nucleoside-diphosphate kinase
VLSGNRAIDIARTLMGKTFGYEAAPGTIRGDFGASRSFNLVHGSDSPESAAAEIALYFGKGDVLSYAPAGSQWVFPADDK